MYVGIIIFAPYLIWMTTIFVAFPMLLLMFHAAVKHLLAIGATVFRFSFANYTWIHFKNDLTKKENFNWYGKR